MPSPFPGMDPYLEAPGIWPGFHHSLASEIRSDLNRTLPPRYYANLESRAELGIIGELGDWQPYIPDIVVVSRPIAPPDAGGGGIAVAARPRREVSPSISFRVRSEAIRHLFVEIRDASLGHKLITLIEILSPSNKRSGPDRDAYESKQRDVLGSDANLIEVDLLRGGRRVLADFSLKASIARLAPQPTYVVMTSRAWHRGANYDYQVFPIGLRETLPCIAVPLKEGEEEIPMDLQYVFDRAYDTGPYRRGAVDYAGPVPAPPLDEADAAWAAELTRPWREAKADAPGG